jgi:hypothetical protein
VRHGSVRMQCGRRQAICHDEAVMLVSASSCPARRSSETRRIHVLTSSRPRNPQDSRPQLLMMTAEFVLDSPWCLAQDVHRNDRGTRLEQIVVQSDADARLANPHYDKLPSGYERMVRPQPQRRPSACCSIRTSTAPRRAVQHPVIPRGQMASRSRQRRPSTRHRLR